MGGTELNADVFNSASKLIIESLNNGLLENHKMELTNHFAKGIYVRELFIPKGTVLIGKIHRYECINIMLSGDITIYGNGEEERISKPFVAVSPPGTQKAGIAHKDTIWLNIHATESKDVEEIEKEVIATSYDDSLLLKELRRLKG